MPDIEKLIRLMKELEDQLVVCMRCGMCQSVCPLFDQTGREADVARGKLALLDGLMSRMLSDPEAVEARLNRCLLCGSCAANCPSGVRVLEIFIKARAILTEYSGLPPAKRAILRGVLANPSLMNRLTRWSAKSQPLVSRPVNDIVGTSCARIGGDLLKGRHFVPMASEAFHAQVPELNIPAGASGLRVGFFPGCLLDKFFPRIAHAVISVLKHHEVGIFMPADQGCCGIPALSSGDTRTFAKLLRYNLEKFETGEFDYVVTACATCTSTLKELWPIMAETAGVDPVRVRKFSERTLDIHEFLVCNLSTQTVAGEPEDAADAGNAPVVTYHDPCHLRKSLGVFEAPRQLIRRHSGYRFREMENADTCCGMGGSFNLQHYDISSRIGAEKQKNIAETGCAVVATGCPACMMQISDALSRAGNRIAVKHAIEIYLEALKEP